MTTQDYTKQAQDFLDKFGIKFRATLSDIKPAPWEPAGHHYRVTLSRNRITRDQVGGNWDNGLKTPTRIVFDFWGSIADAKSGKLTVDAYDVLACISGDVNCPESFEDFCSEYGYDRDSIKALQSFRRCSAFAKRLRSFFTAEEIEQLQEIQ